MTLNMPPLTDCPTIEIRGFKWPRRPKSVAKACFIGEDVYGKWVGIAKGNVWRELDSSRSGVFETSFIKLFPGSPNAFWTACFCLGDVVIDVDISLPVTWLDAAVEEIDLELDILRTSAGHVVVRDQEQYAHVRDTLAMPAHIAAEAERTSEYIRAQVEQSIEPFGKVGIARLHRFLDALES